MQVGSARQWEEEGDGPLLGYWRLRARQIEDEFRPSWLGCSSLPFFLQFIFCFQTFNSKLIFKLNQTFSEKLIKICF